MDIIAYCPADGTMEEVFVWGSLPTTSNIARAFADAESASSCKCMGCVAQRRRAVVASLAEALAGASLVTRHSVAGNTVFPRHCLIGGDVDPTLEVAHSEFQREYACIAVHRVVQEVMRSSHETRLTSGPCPVALAWR